MDTKKLIKLAVELEELEQKKNTNIEDRKQTSNRIYELEIELKRLYSAEDEITNRSIAIRKEIAIMVSQVNSVEKYNYRNVFYKQ